MAIEIVDFPINSMVIFHSYVKLPEGTALQYFVVNNMQIPSSLLQNFRPFFPERLSLCVKAQIGKSSCKSVRQIPLSLKNAN